jgi:hypothetical protein
VFSGMIGVTLFGLFLTPVFFVTLMSLGRRKAVAVPVDLAHADLGATTSVAGAGISGL